MAIITFHAQGLSQVRPWAAPELVGGESHGPGDAGQTPSSGSHMGPKASLEVGLGSCHRARPHAMEQG